MGKDRMHVTSNEKKYGGFKIAPCNNLKCPHNNGYIPFTEDVVIKSGAEEDKVKKEVASKIPRCSRCGDKLKPGQVILLP